VIATRRRGSSRIRSRAFGWLWFSQSVSLFGSEVTFIAIPLLAALSLGADALQMGMLAAVETVPYLVLAIPAGVLADRIDRRGLLIVSNLARAAFLLAIPASALLGFLSLPLLYAVAFAVGAVSVVFDVAYESYVPELLEAEDLLKGNQRLELSESAARTLGPGLGGALVVALGGAFAVFVDAASYIVASIALLGARRPKPALPAERQDGLAESAPGETASPMPMPAPDGGLDSIVDYATGLEARIAALEQGLASREEPPSKANGGAWVGLRLVLRDRALRDMAASTATFNLASSAILAVFVLFAATEVGMDGAGIGILLGAGNVGFVVGALAVGAVTARFGVGPTLVVAGVLGAVATVILPFAAGPAAVALLFAGRFVGAFAIPLFNVNARTLRQSRVSSDALGRVNAVFRLIDWGTLPVGALLGGWVGTVYGLHATLALGGVFGVASAAWLIWSPLRHVRRLDGDPDDVADTVVPVGSPDDLRSPRPAMLGAAGATGWPLTVTGRLPTIRWPWLAIGGLLVQLALSLPPVGAQFGSAAPWLYVSSAAAVLACVLRNVRIPGLAIIGVGGASNLVAIVANGGYMPVSPEGAQAVGHALASGYGNTVMAANPILKPLTDIIIVPPPLPLANVYSIGDLLIVMGLAVMLAVAVYRQTRGEVSAHADPNWSTRNLGTTAS
jgi:MFS family permease